MLFLTRGFINEIFPFKNNPAKDGIFDFSIFLPRETFSYFTGAMCEAKN
jgi:hypothetical protein